VFVADCNQTALIATCALVGGSSALSSSIMSTMARTPSAPNVAASLQSLAVGDHLHATQSVMSTMQQLAVAQQLQQQQQQVCFDPYVSQEYVSPEGRLGFNPYLSQEYVSQEGCLGFDPYVSQEGCLGFNPYVSQEGSLGFDQSPEGCLYSSLL